MAKNKKQKLVQYFETALTDRAQVETDDGVVTVEMREVGKLVTGGYVTACDAGENFPPKSLDLQIYPGSHPVKLSLVQLPDGNLRCGLATVWVIDTPPVTWKLASFIDAYPGVKWNNPQRNEKSSDIPWGGQCVAIDSGMCCFMDVQVGWMLGLEDEVFWDRADQAFEKLGKRARDHWNAGTITVDKRFGLNVVGFSSGWGDGCYPLFWGIDKEGEVCRLTVDFGLLGEPK